MLAHAEITGYNPRKGAGQGKRYFMYIYECENWPNFIWDNEQISDLLTEVRYLQGRLFGGMESIGFHLRDETIALTLTQDIVKSSEIEGEILDQSIVRSSVARHLGMDIGALDKVDRNVEGIVEMVLNATQAFDVPLTKERILNWHSSLFPEGRSGFKKINVGMWRTGPVYVVSENRGEETIHFEAPRAERVDYEMTLFLDWLNHETKIDLVLKAAIAHLWFVTIHPFDDGNGRIGRAVADFLLARSEKSSHRFYSLSAQIQKERKSYYIHLEQTQKGTLEITNWIEWFVHCLKRAIEKASETYQLVVNKKVFWDSCSEINLNERQKKIINLLLEGFEGKLTTSKWAKVAKCSQDTAYRDILDLIDKGILIKNADGGRSTSYSLISQ